MSADTNQIFEDFKSIYKSCNSRDEFREKADILFELAKQLTADQIIEPTVGDNRWNYFHSVCLDKPAHALEIVDKLTPQQIYIRVNKEQYSPLLFSLSSLTENKQQIAYDLMVAIIKNASTRGLTSVSRDDKTDLEIILSDPILTQDKKGEIVSLIIGKMIDNMMNTGKVSSAMMIGKELSTLVQDFIHRIVRIAQESFVRSETAHKIMDEQIKLIRDFTKSARHFGQYPSHVVNPNKIIQVAQSTGALPKPSSLSEINFTKALNSITKSLDSSHFLLKQYEHFNEIAPNLMNNIQMTLDEITRGINVLNSKQQKDNSDQRKLDILLTIKSSIQRDILLMTAINGTNQFSQNVEVEFWRAGMNMKDMIKASMVNTSLLLTKLKAQSSGKLSADNKAVLREQLQSIADTGQAFIEIAEQRKQDIGNMKIEMIPLRLPMPTLDGN